MSAVVEAPGIYPGFSEDLYHRDTVALSSSGARRIIQATPAHFRHEQLHALSPTDAMVLGSAVHSLALGVGPRVVELPFDSWRTSAAKEAAAEVRASGGIPLLGDAYRKAVAMADAIRLHPLAGPLIESAPPERRELSGWWIDDDTGIWCRVRFDAVGEIAGRPVVVDVKTAASRAAFRKAIDGHGYDQQDAWYREAAHVLGLSGEWPDFLFAVVESAPPYAAFVSRDSEWVERGYARNRRARETFARCVEADDWPAYPIEIDDVPMPRWASAS